jgi:hydrogenase maturation protease
VQSQIESSKNRTLVIGIGNEFRGDDAFGLVVARRLQERRLDHLTVLEQSGEGAALMEAWKGFENVILIDAVQSGAEPGTVFRFEAHTQRIPTQFFHYSTHAFSVAEAIELARALNQLPPRLVVYGIEGRNFETGTELSPTINDGVKRVVERIKQEIEFASFYPRLTNHNHTSGTCQSISGLPNLRNAALVLENGRLPKKPLVAESGEG